MFLSSLFEEFDLLESPNDLFKVANSIRYAAFDKDNKRRYTSNDLDAVKNFAKEMGMTVRKVFSPKQMPTGAQKLKLITDDKDVQDTVVVDIPLLIRILEYAREDAKTDMDLHNMVELILKHRKENKPMTMRDYDSIVPNSVTEAVVSAKEKKMNPGVEVGGTVYVKAPGYDWTLRTAKLLRIGASGLAHIRLKKPMGDHPNIPDFFKNQTDIAVPPSWLFKTIESAWPADWKKPKDKINTSQEKLL